MEDNKSLKDKIIETIHKNYITTILIITILQLVSIITPLNVFYSILLFFLNLSTFILFKELVEEEEKKKSFKFIKVAMYLFVFSFFMALNKKVSLYKNVTPFFIILSIAVSSLVTIFLLDEDNKYIVDNIYNTNIASKIKLVPNIKPKLEPGDVRVCINKDTGADVIIPMKDRFLHSLTLGPTGCGKTSKIFTPMIHQDIQNFEYGVTAIDPKGDFAELVHAMAKYYGRESMYFNPTHPDCPYFNPLAGDEDIVIENTVTVFNMLGGGGDEKPFFKLKNETLLRNALKVVKRVYGDKATLLHLSTLVHNPNGQGQKMVMDLEKAKPKTVEEGVENQDLVSYFMDEYFNPKSKEAEHTTQIKSQIAKTISNRHLRRVLNPPNGKNDLDFAKILAEGKVLTISTAQDELADLSSYLGYFIILNFQSAVFARPLPESSRTPHFLYIDEFQEYANMGFSRMLTQGRSFRVSANLATQARDQIALGAGGDIFLHTVSTNARNVFLFPDIAAADAEYYSKEFGEIEYERISKGTSERGGSLFGGGRSHNKTVTKDVKAKFTPSDLKYKSFHEVTYKIIYNGQVQHPEDGITEWIDYDLNQKFEKLADEYREEQNRKRIALDIKEGYLNADDVDDTNVDIDAGLDDDKILDIINEDKDIVEDDFDYRDEVVEDITIEDDLM